MTKPQAKEIALEQARFIEFAIRVRSVRAQNRKFVARLKRVAGERGYVIHHRRAVGTRLYGGFRGSDWFVSLPDGREIPEVICRSWGLVLKRYRIGFTTEDGFFREHPDKPKSGCWYGYDRSHGDYHYDLDDVIEWMPSAEALAKLIHQLKDTRLSLAQQRSRGKRIRSHAL